MIVKETEQIVKHNYALLLFVAMVPLQTVYLRWLPGLGGGLNILNMLLLFAFLVWRFRQDFNTPTHTKLHYPIYFYMVWMFIGIYVGFFALGYNDHRHFYIYKDLMLPAICYFIVVNSARTKKHIQWIIAAAMIPLPLMTKAFYNQYSLVSRWHYDDRLRNVHGTFSTLGSNEFAAYHASYVLIAIALFIFIKNTKFRILLAISIAMYLYCLMFSFSRGAWIAFLVSLLVFLFYWNLRKAFIILIITVIFSGALFTVLPVAVQERFSTIFVEGEERDASATSRLELWSIAMGFYKESPIWGIGYHTFHNVNPYLSDVTGQGKDTHNFFVKILTENGGVGLFVILLILYRIWKSSRMLYSEAEDPLFRALGLGMMGSVVAVVVGSNFGDRFSHYPLITHFWVYAALVQRALLMVREQKNVPSTAHAVS